MQPSSQEDGEVLVEVEGQETDYMSEMERNESSEMSSSAEDESQDEMDEDSQNNNATVMGHDRRRRSQSRGCDNTPDTPVCSRRCEETDDEDEALMVKMEKFMVSKGLMFAPKATQEMTPAHQRTGQLPNSCNKVQKNVRLNFPVQETVSAETIYERAVPLVSERQKRAGNFRDSSSSEDLIDTSGESNDVCKQIDIFANSNQGIASSGGRNEDEHRDRCNSGGS